MASVSISMNCILLLAVSIYLISQNPIIAEKKGEESIPGINVPETCIFLIETDKILIEKYRNRPKGAGEDILNLVIKYNEALRYIVQQATKENEKYKSKTITEAKALIDHGGPEFMNFYVDTPILEEEFGLNSTSSHILYAQRQQTVNIWQEFYKIYSLIPDSDESI